jgi:hypothetical protein
VIRYLALSTFIVLTIAIAIAAWVNRDLIRLKIASVYARVPVKPGESQAPRSGSTAGLRGDAPWALSALPECVRQQSESRGTPLYVRAHVPPNASPIVPPDNLRYGNCTIAVRGWEAFVRRGNDVFRIPPRVQFFKSGNLLVMLRIANGSGDLRIYQPATP